MQKAILEHCDHPDGIEFFYEQVYKCAQRMREDAIFVEIGNYRGGSSLAMLEAIKNTKPRWLYTIDPYGTKPFKVEKEYDDSKYDEDIYRDAMKLLSDYAHKNKLNHYHWRMTSDDFMKIYPKIDFWHNGTVVDPIFGCVYIDGEHTPEQVNREIEFFYNRMPNGGLIILDDTPFVSSSLQYTKKILSGIQDNFRTYFVK